MIDFLNDKNHIHFIGIGGSGMYPLAQILHAKGFYLTGSDNNETETLNAVREMGINVTLGHSPKNIEGADLVVFTAAIMRDNPELNAAYESGVEVKERSELLGLVTSWYKKAVCVCGTHGKTTASSMLTHVYLGADFDISAFLGGKLKAIGGSARLGSDSNDIMVIEACEFNDTFLKLYPNVTVILNIDEDHLDYFKTMDNLRLSFTKFCNITTDIIVYNGDDDNTKIAVTNSSFNGNKYTFGWTENNDFYPTDIKKISDFRTDFILNRNGKKLTDISVFVPGRHNIINAVAACAAAAVTGCKDEKLGIGLKSFYGTGRRFEKIYEKGGITVVDDYAHHPAEIEATLKTAKEMNYKRVWAVHQPFTYSRTSRLLNEFAEALRIADEVVLTEIMGGRETNLFDVCSKDLAEKIGNDIFIGNFEQIAEYTVKNAGAGDLIITLGCGDVYKAAVMIAEQLHKL